MVKSASSRTSGGFSLLGLEPELAAALASLGIEQSPHPRAGLVAELRRGFSTWDEVEDSLTGFYAAAKAAFAETAPIVVIVRESALIGRAEVLDSAHAGALLSAVRTLALEGARQQQVAVLIAVSEKETADAVAGAIAFAVRGGHVTGQAIHVGSEHFGRSQP